MGLYFFNAFFVSGVDVFFDCRVTANADSNGCRLCSPPPGAGCTYGCFSAYPVLTVCPIDVPTTVNGCKELYETYSSFVDNPVSYYSYASDRCMLDDKYFEDLHRSWQKVSQSSAPIVGVTITPVQSAGVPGCQDTPAGCYVPSVAKANVGDNVIFTNADVLTHTFASGTVDDGFSGLFDSGVVLPDMIFVWTPTVAGEIQYFCYIHPWMSGLIVVE